MSSIRFNLTPYTEDLTTIMKDIALKRYGKSIAIIAMYGSRARGDYEEDSDLEFFAVTDDEKIKVDIEFTFNGIPVDMWSKSFDYFEKVAQIDEYWILPAGTLSYCEIIYVRSEEDKIRFESLIKKATQSGKYYEKNLENAAKYFDGMFKYLGLIQFAKHKDDIHEARDACWGLIIGATYVVAHVNSRPLQNNWGQN
jgi:predicted nucleotidyltransferase